MNNKGSLIPIALITILLGSGLRLSLPAASGDSGTSEQRPSDSSLPKSSVEAAQSNRDDQPDTLDVVAESLGMEVSKDQLRKRAVESVEVLRSRDKSAEWPDAIRFLQEFFRLAIRKDAPKLDEARTAAGKLADSSDPPPSAVQAIEQFLDRYFNEDALRIEHPTDEAKLLAEDFSRLDTEPLVIALLRRAAHDQNITVRFLVATLPDAVDSHAGWQFDPMLDAIQQAITADDYLLDRFHLPDSDVERDSRASADRQMRRVHEREPGVVVFRKHREQGKENAGLLVLLLVQESPTAGVHQAAFVGALSLINKWNASTQGAAASPEGDDHVFRILGPTFSGSSQSLARILRALSSTTLRDARVRLVSGSATNRQNKRTLEGAIPDRVRFQATVQPDDHLLCSQAKYLEEAGWSRPVAVLFETNTDYGRQIGERLGKRCLERESRGATPASEFGVIQLPFPMNISRLRVTAQSVKPGAPDPWAMPSRFRPLAMEESGNPTDQLPVLSPRTTASYMELALAGLLQTLGRESIGTVALMATDSRDKLFLAQQISQYSPNVSIFTAESDSLYIHPDYSSYLRGTLVASTYGLFNANQRWSYPYEGSSSRLQFATGSAQGIYNATLALLDYTEDGRRISADAPQLVEYGPPGQACSPSCEPPVWISVVGQDGSWPVQWYAGQGEGENGYVFPLKPGTDVGLARVSQVGFSSPLFSGFLTLLTAVIVIFWLDVRGIGSNALSGGLSRPFGALLSAARRQQLSALLRGRRSTDGEGRGYLLAAAVSLLLIETFVAAICVTWFRVELSLRTGSAWDGPVWAAAGALAAALVSLLMLIDVGARALVELVRRDLPRPLSGISLKQISPRGALAGSFVGIFGWGVGNLQWYAWMRAAGKPVQAIGFLERATHLESGVCPTIPVFLLGTALFLWATSELTRLRNRGVALAAEAVHPLVQHTVNGGLRDIEGSWTWLNRSMLAVPTGLLVAALLGVAATCELVAFDPFVAPLVTIEGVNYGRFVSATLLLVQMMIALSLLQFISLWFGLKQLLQRMVFHPLARAYERVPRELLPPSLFPRVPSLVELQVPVARWHRYVKDASLTAGGAAAIPAECLNLSEVFQNEMQTSLARDWSGRETWKLLMNAASVSAAQLQLESGSGNQRRNEAVPTGPKGPAEGGHVGADAVASSRAVKQPADAPGGDCEEVVAMSMVFVIRDALARLGHNLVFITGGVLLVFCSHTLFPFEARHRLQVLAWTYVGLTFAGLLTVIMQIKRDEILGRVASVTPGVRTTWDANFVLRLAVFGLLPLLTLFAAQFPEVGGTLLRWLAPVQKVLP